jgi:uncharacterized membrane protein YdbT with pleckstrin-like domain
VALELHPDEQVIFEGHPSWRGTLSFYARGVVVAAIGAGIAAIVTAISSKLSLGVVIAVFAALVVLVVLAGFVYRMTTTYGITNQRLTIRRGLLSRHVQETRVERVQNVNTNQSLMDRLLRVGQVDFDTAGSDDSDFTFRGVASPERVVKAVDEAHRARELAARQASPGGI